tara:strand:- start:738 stop:914 length:177 start_codon:yes stop_codon:yes gene_type:complete
MDTLYPWFLRSTPRDAAAIPFPNEETTPPVKKMYFVLGTTNYNEHTITLQCLALNLLK